MSTQRLTEFLAAVSGFRDEASAIQGAAQLAAEALAAEAAAVLAGDELLAGTLELPGPAPATPWSPPSTTRRGGGCCCPAATAGSATRRPTWPGRWAGS